jgi:GNAT superfamily N-acetyltransferase
VSELVLCGFSVDLLNELVVMWRHSFVAACSDSVAQLHVRVGYFRQGIGSKLLAWAQSQSRGCLRLYTFALYQRARQFYEHHGFRATAHGFEPVWQLAVVRYEWSRDAASTP